MANDAANLHIEATMRPGVPNGLLTLLWVFTWALVHGVPSPVPVWLPPLSNVSAPLGRRRADRWTVDRGMESARASSKGGRASDDLGTLDDTSLEIRSLAARLVAARRERVPVPLLTAGGPLSLLDAYDIQRLSTDLWQRETGSRAVGYKISLTSDETQSVLNTSEPSYGHLFDEQILRSPAEVSLGGLFSPLIEPELVFVFDEDLPPHAGHDDIRRCARIAPGFELPDARYESWFGEPALTLPDFVADNSAAGMVIIGEAVPATAAEWHATEVEVTLDGARVQYGHATAVLGNPLRSVAWLSRQLALRNEGLRAGDIVSSGTFCPPVRLRTGLYLAAFAQLGVVSVTVTE